MLLVGEAEADVQFDCGASHLGNDDRHPVKARGGDARELHLDVSALLCAKLLDLVVDLNPNLRVDHGSLLQRDQVRYQQ